MESAGRKTVFEKLAGISILLTFSVAYPYFFHLAGLSGRTFLPIYLAVLVSSRIFPLPTTLLIAVSSPLLNNFVSGMPVLSPEPVLQMLMVELIFLSFSGRFLKRVPAALSLLIQMVIARLGSLPIVVFSSTTDFEYWKNNFLAGISGIAFNLAVGYLILRIFYERKV